MRADPATKVECVLGDSWVGRLHILADTVFASFDDQNLPNYTNDVKPEIAPF
jgi:hypothetical protein